MGDVVGTAPADRHAGRLRHLLRAGHPRQALLLAGAIGLAALLDGRPAREVLVAAAAVLVVQLALGLGNDIADQAHDYRGEVAGKPIAAGVLPAGDAGYVVAVLVLLAIPLSLQNGIAAGLALLVTLPIGWLNNGRLHRTALSFVPWMATFALYPFFLSYGGWGGGDHGGPPSWPVVAAGAAIGLCAHFLTTLPDLADDERAAARNLPLLIALRIGARRLLLLTAALSLASAAALVAALLTTGLRP